MKTRFLAFVAEQFPFALRAGTPIIDGLFEDRAPGSDLRKFGKLLTDRLIQAFKPQIKASIETLPGSTLEQRFDQEASRIKESLEGFFEREHKRALIKPSEKIWMLRGMITTRAVDLVLKKIFLSSELKYQELSFQGKGFRSLGQEAVYAAALYLRRGEEFRKESRYKGDVVGPVIRDLGVALAFSNDDVESAINAQAGKSGPPMDGRDLHIGDYAQGVWPPAAPLAISACSTVGIAFAAQLRKEERVCVSFIGEGGTSLGEWHEAVNFAAVRKMPIVFCIENNQTALSTKTHLQSAVRTFADKAVGYGIPSLTLDGTDPEAIAVGFAWAAERARTGLGPCIIELICMRMCGHAHHDDMLYLGHEPTQSFDYPTLSANAYVDVDKFALWSKKDPIKVYSEQLIEDKICSAEQVKNWITETRAKCDQALESIKSRSWPKPSFSTHDFTWKVSKQAQEIEAAPEFQRSGSTYMEAIAQAVYERMKEDSSVYLLGEDVEPPYGNAFMMFRNAPKELWPRFINTPISENAIVGALVGMAAEGMRPIGEMQFNDFSASAFDQIVNNAAKLKYRTGISAPFVLRMPWGGLRRAGPYHSQDTIPWYHRAFGLNIVAPSTPSDARALFHASMQSDDPVLFYEHIALYRDPSIKQSLAQNVPQVPLGRAAFRRLGNDLTLVSYGAFVHRIQAVASRLADEHNIQCDVIDLRSLVPLDFDALGASLAKTGKIMLVGEDSRTGSILESIASKIAEALFQYLDAPVKVVGSLDTPIPYSPPLEDAYLPSNDFIFSTALDLARF